MENVQFEYKEKLIDGIGHWLWRVGDFESWENVVNHWPPMIKFWLKHIKNNQVVLQAGGNAGVFPRLFAKYFNLVYTWEPEPINFHCLVNNCRYNKIIKTQAALGEKFDFIEMGNLNGKNSGEANVIDGFGGSIPMVNIDAYPFFAVDFIQLDVEGYEHNVLKGAEQTIKKFKPLISTEKSIENFKHVQKIMKEFKYHEIGQAAYDVLWVTD